MLAWIMVAIATAGAPYLESDPLATRADAAARAEAVEAAGCDAKVVRRFLQGDGWRFVVRVAGPITAPCRVALDAVDAPPASGREDAGAIDPDDPGVDEGGVPMDGEDTDAVVATGDAPRAREVLQRMVRRHRGPVGAVGEARPDAVVFRFRRRAQGRVIDHVYARRGDDRYLEIQVVEGAGRSSRAGLVDGCPWYDGAVDHPLDAEATAQAFERFSPEQVLAFATSLTGPEPDLPDPDTLRVERPAGEGTLVLVFPGDRAVPPLRIEVDEATSRVVSVSRGPAEVAVVRRYEGWREQEGAALRPVRVITTRGAQVLDELEIEELDGAPVLPDEWFPACSTE